MQSKQRCIVSPYLIATLLTISGSITALKAGPYKLKCKGPYQIIQGQLLSTPPCEEAYIAKVARSYGYKVSTKDIRNNPNKKIQICNHIGYDNRLHSICGAYRGPIGPNIH